MRILLVNKFLHPVGGTETYVFKLGAYLSSHGHEVQYFGMEHDGRLVGNHVDSYTQELDFHGGSKVAKLTYPFKIIYSKEARRKIRKVLDDFQPDVVHMNNINYQLTPAIILEIVEWREHTGHNCKLIFTAHDYNLVCPNYKLYNPNTHKICEKCLGGHFSNCTKGIHGSKLRSCLGEIEAKYWNKRNVYENIDTIICCSRFLKTKLDTNPVLAKKTIALHNFVNQVARKDVQKGEYVLYFGRFSDEKGIGTLIEVCKQLSEIQFIFAGAGPLDEAINNVSNIQNMGFQSGDTLENLIREAMCSVYPSEWYENCPFSVMESIMYGTPVIGANIGGIPELIDDGVTGILFEPGNAASLKNSILELVTNASLREELTINCRLSSFESIEKYSEKLLRIYKG